MSCVRLCAWRRHARARTEAVRERWMTLVVATLRSLKRREVNRPAAIAHATLRCVRCRAGPATTSRLIRTIGTPA